VADPPFKIGDQVWAEFTHGEATTSGLVTRHAGPIVALTPTHAQVQCAGYLVWLDLGILNKYLMQGS